ncbi:MULTISPECIES: helix-turn-helix transcriptional regulator [unclassified Streptomyces]|uniref:helix-turn-helix transcriptional regulator n=1 Tax=unclassified Streptomyces TaxID=2593676 RepID=UPI002E124B0D|nr:helix-turn-helix transcriptional regulator [Streptomyces sp. NBC_01197]WSS52191.1 helix-turn-helix transcriptional regulator [Streptomyces sp. NBC_01180]
MSILDSGDGKLERIGAQVYERARRRGGIDGRDAAQELGISVKEAEEVLENLRSLHLLRTVGGAGVPVEAPDKRMEAVPVELAFGLLTGGMEHSLREALDSLGAVRRGAAGLRALFQTLTLEGGDGDGPLRIPDTGTVNELIEEAASACVEEVLTCQPGGGRPAQLLREVVDRDLAMLGRGVRMKVLYQHAARRDRPTQAYVEKAVGHGAQVRTLADLPPRFIAFDRSVAFLADAEAPEGATVVTQPLTVRFLCRVFDAAWTHGTPFRSSVGNGALAEGVQRSIIRMLADGMRDDMIARRLAISLRTCRKHISEIMQRFDSETRFQAGFAIREFVDAEALETPSE